MMSTWHTRWWHSQRWGKAQLAHHCTRAVRRSQSEQSRLPTRRREVYACMNASVRACVLCMHGSGCVLDEKLSKLGGDQCMPSTSNEATERDRRSLRM